MPIPITARWPREKKRKKTPAVKADAAFGEEIDSLAPAHPALRAFCSAKWLSCFPSSSSGRVGKDVVESFLHVAHPMRGERGLAQFIAFQSVTFRGHGMIGWAGQRVAETEDDPFTGGETPVQSSVGGQFGSEINNIPALHDSVRRVVGFGGRRIGRAH